MLRIKTHLSPSSIHGIGVFASENIKEGELVWSYEENFDRRFAPEDFYKLSPAIHDYYKTYGYQSRIDHYHYLPFDNDRFMNHADSPNISYDAHGNFIATRSIAAGEELTCDYREFDEEWDQYGAQLSSSIVVNTQQANENELYDSRPMKSSKPKVLINS